MTPEASDWWLPKKSQEEQTLLFFQKLLNEEKGISIRVIVIVSWATHAVDLTKENIFRASASPKNFPLPTPSVTLLLIAPTPTIPHPA